MGVGLHIRIFKYFYGITPNSMKTIQLIVLLFVSHFSFAKIWIVDSNSGSTAKDFTNLQAAHDGATGGDTLYLIGSPVNYITTKVTVTKRLVIIGPGYFLSQNADTQANVASAFLNNTAVGICEELEFASGSEGSVLTGVEIIGRIVINVNNILIKRNHIIQEDACNLTQVTINGSNVILAQNFIEGNLNNGGLALVQITAGKSGISVNNNFLLHGGYGSAGGAMALRSTSTSSVEASNNYFYGGGIEVTNSLVQNNLFRWNNVLTFTSSLVRNNTTNNGVSSSLPAGNDNINNSSFNAEFIGTGSTDGQWQLSATATFKGTGFGGTDRGMFGSAEPYVLSGIPPIPTIYFLTAPTIGEKNTGLPVQIKVKSNN